MVKFCEDALVLDQQPVASATYRLRLHCPQIAGSGRAGQFVLLRVTRTLEPLLRRPFSFHRLLPAEGVIEVLYKVVGRGTHLLSQALPGARLNLLGPLGNGFSLPPEPGRPVALLAGGIGIAPLFALLARLLAAGWASSSVRLFYGARSADELLAPEEFAAFGIPVTWTTDDGSLGDKGFVTDALGKALETGAFRPAFLYACGTLAMQYQVARLAAVHRIAAELSLEALMACGVGACLGCALPAPHPSDPTADHYLHVCKDGPIFSPGSIQWQKVRYQRPQPPMSLFS
jgi:dihydroorotate dehydrogenase electron transfer subunit